MDLACRWMRDRVDEPRKPEDRRTMRGHINAAERYLEEGRMVSAIRELKSAVEALAIRVTELEERNE